MDNKSQSSIGPIKKNSRSQSPRNQTPYSRLEDNHDDINETRIQVIEKRKIKNILNEQKLEYKSLLDEFQIKFDKINFDLNNSDSFVKEYYIELRRQVQIAKELKIQKLEDQSEAILVKIDEYEKNSLALKVNKDDFFVKLNEMKLENEKWLKSLTEREIDFKLNNDQVKESIGRLSCESKNLESLLFDGKLVQFNENENGLGEIISIELDVLKNNDDLNKIDISDHLKHYNKCNNECKCLNCSCGLCNDIHECDNEYLNHDFVWKLINFASDGEIVLIGIGNNSESTDTMLFQSFIIIEVFDVKKNILKMSKRLEFACDYEVEYQATENKICLVYRSHTSFEIQTILVLNENLEQIQKNEIDLRFMRNNLIGANDSFLFFLLVQNPDPNPNQIGILKGRHKSLVPSLLIYNWELVKVKQIGQGNDPEMPFYISFLRYDFYRSKFSSIFGRYYCQDDEILSIIDVTSGLQINKIKTLHFIITSNRCLILIDERSIKYSNLDGNIIWREIIIDTDLIIDVLNSIWILNQNNELYCFIDENKTLFKIKN